LVGCTKKQARFKVF